MGWNCNKRVKRFKEKVKARRRRVRLEIVFVGMLMIASES